MRSRHQSVPAALAGAGLAVLALVCGACGTEQRSHGAANGPLLQPAGDRGPDAFTAGSALSTPPPLTRTEQPVPTGTADDTRAARVTGDSPGLYAGTAARGSCDVARQTRLLAQDRRRAAAFARASGVAADGLDRYLDDLTPVTLRADTLVTSHGYRGQEVTEYPAVLQAGTAVLVDAHGVPRVRCGCGNPLGEPEDDSVRGHRGTAWSGYRADRVHSVTPAGRPLPVLVLADSAHGLYLERPVGDDGGHDRTVPAPKNTPKPPPEPESSAPDSPSPDSTEPWESTPPPTRPDEEETPEGGEETARPAHLLSRPTDG